MSVYLELKVEVELDHLSGEKADDVALAATLIEAISNDHPEYLSPAGDSMYGVGHWKVSW